MFISKFSIKDIKFVLYFVFAFFCFNLFIYFHTYATQIKAKNESYSNSKETMIKNINNILIANENDIVFGNNNTNEIIEYFDFSCYYCQKFFQENFENIYNNYISKNKIKFVFRPYILSENSLYASKFLFCKLDKRLESENLLIMKIAFQVFDIIANKLDNKNYIQIFYQLLKQSGVNINNFYKCINSNDNIKNFQQIKSDAKKINLDGVPSFYLNKQIIIPEKFLKLLNNF